VQDNKLLGLIDLQQRKILGQGEAEPIRPQTQKFSMCNERMDQTKIEVHKFPMETRDGDKSKEFMQEIAFVCLPRRPKYNH
jgi:hypothetical protein